MTIRHAWEWTTLHGTAIAFAPPAGSASRPEGYRVNLRFVDWIWHVRGSLALEPGQSSDEAFERLDPLFVGQAGTSYERTGDTLTFRKKDAAAQDRMSVFNNGALWIEKGAEGSVLRYDLVSRFMLFCFLAPLLFLAFGQLTLTIAKYQKPPEEASAKAGKPGDAAKKPGDKASAKASPKAEDIKMNPIDKFLGAPAPDKKKDGEKGKKGEKDGKRNKKPSATAAYVFASFFAILYVVGRILEAWLVKRLFRKSLLPA